MSATQLELFGEVPQPEPPANDWGVWVNECGINATRQAANWWATFWLRSPPDRITCLVMSIAGGHHHVACDSREDAEWLRDHMVEMGVSPTHVKVQRLADAQKVAEKRRAAFDATSERLAEFMAEWNANRPVPEGIEP